MRTPIIVIATVVLVLLTASCALIEKARYAGAEYAGRAVALECALSLDEREKNLIAVNGWLLANNITSRAVAFDCDADGSPDF